MVALHRVGFVSVSRRDSGIVLSSIGTAKDGEPDLPLLLTATDHDAKDRTVEIRRYDRDAEASNDAESSTHLPIDGVIGTIHLEHAIYLMVITSKTKVGTWPTLLATAGKDVGDNGSIFRLDRICLLPLNQPLLAGRILSESAGHAASRLATPHGTDDTVPTAQAAAAADITVEERHRRRNSSSSTVSSTVSSRGGEGKVDQNGPTPTAPSSSSRQARSMPKWMRSVLRRPNASSGRAEPSQISSTHSDTSSLASQRSASFEVDATAADHSALAAGPIPAPVHSANTASNTVSPAMALDARDGVVLREMTDWLQSGIFYFAYDFDLTANLQQQQQQQHGGAREDRFYWNLAMQSALRNAAAHAKVDIDRWCLPLILGYVGEFQHTYQVDAAPEAGATPATERSDRGGTGERTCRLLLVSRREKLRPGMRYVTRGIDEAYNVANAVETEQVLCFQNHEEDAHHHITSFVQLRGSSKIFLFVLSPETVATEYIV